MTSPVLCSSREPWRVGVTTPTDSLASTAPSPQCQRCHPSLFRGISRHPVRLPSFRLMQQVGRLIFIAASTTTTTSSTTTTGGTTTTTTSSTTTTGGTTCPPPPPLPTAICTAGVWTVNQTVTNNQVRGPLSLSPRSHSIATDPPHRLRLSRGPRQFHADIEWHPGSRGDEQRNRLTACEWLCHTRRPPHSDLHRAAHHEQREGPSRSTMQCRAEADVAARQQQM
jgi:hypothetical protein